MDMVVVLLWVKENGDLCIFIVMKLGILCELLDFFFLWWLILWELGGDVLVFGCWFWWKFLCEGVVWFICVVFLREFWGVEVLFFRVFFGVCKVLFCRFSCICLWCKVRVLVECIFWLYWWYRCVLFIL